MKSPVRRYVRAKLQRRLFAWFAATIVVTGLTVGLVLLLLGPSGGWQRDMAGARAFVANRFAAAWHDPRERDAVAADLSRLFGAGVELRDAQQASLARFGAPCERAAHVVPIERAGEALGTATLCPGPRRRHGPRIALPLALAGLVLWGAAGVLARRLSRPIVELARVASAIGAGRLDARYRPPPGSGGEVAALGEAVNDMAARIERQIADQRELLAAVSHEIRTPLARIRLLTEMARDAPETGAKTLDEIDREIAEIDRLVGELLASSRLDFSALSLRALDAAEAARRALERAGESGDERLDVEERGLVLRADATLLARALANLLDNARRHGGGVERVRVRRAGYAVAFEVLDRGPGLPPGDEERIFEPFYGRSRGDPTSLGLGLALVRRIAEAHGGRAIAANRPDGGARVWIELPEQPAVPEV